MANTKLIFLDKDNFTELECFATTSKGVVLKLTREDSLEVEIELDISTAIKFSKTLRTNINIAKEYEAKKEDWLDESLKEEGSHE